nr:hypothetical protein BaRGS_014623 [Batillaria attramentaria]
MKMYQAAVTNDAITRRMLELRDIDVFSFGAKPADKISDYRAYSKLPAIPPEALLGIQREMPHTISKPTIFPPLAFLSDDGKISRPYKQGTEPAKKKPAPKPKPKPQPKALEIKKPPHVPVPHVDLLQLPNVEKKNHEFKVVEAKVPRTYWTNYMRNRLARRDKSPSITGTDTGAFDRRKLEDIARSSFNEVLP